MLNRYRQFIKESTDATNTIDEIIKIVDSINVNTNELLIVQRELQRMDSTFLDQAFLNYVHSKDRSKDVSFRRALKTKDPEILEEVLENLIKLVKPYHIPKEVNDAFESICMDEVAIFDDLLSSKPIVMLGYSTPGVFSRYRDVKQDDADRYVCHFLWKSAFNWTAEYIKEINTEILKELALLIDRSEQTNYKIMFAMAGGDLEINFIRND